MTSYIAVVRLPILSCVSLLCAVALQGCNITVPRHSLGNWEAKPNYLTGFQYVIPGSPKTAILNSCNDPAIAGTSLPCNGNGKCRAWNDLALGADAQAKRLSFCECDRDYADPECHTPRKSQLTAFVLAMFFGMFGVEQFYLGFPRYGTLKLLLVGLIGIWCALRMSRSDKASTFRLKACFLGVATFYYLYEVVRTGSTAVLTAHNFRVADDLTHFSFVLSTVALMLFIGFAVAIWSIHDLRKRKAHELLLLRLDAQEAKEEELQHHPGLPWPSRPMTGDPSLYTGYGSTLNGRPKTNDPRPPTGPSGRMPQSQPPTMPEEIMLRSGARMPPPTLPLGHFPVQGAPMPSVTLAQGAPMPPVTIAPPSKFMSATPSTLTASVMAAQSSGDMLLPQVKGLRTAAQPMTTVGPGATTMTNFSGTPASYQPIEAIAISQRTPSNLLASAQPELFHQVEGEEVGRKSLGFI